jgi:RNA polymerase sigma-70 factor (ECF subfamily)
VPFDDNSQTGSPTSELEQEVAEVYQRHGTELVAYAATIAPDTDLAKDAVQEAFLRFFVERTYGRVVKNPRAWLYRVVHNYLLDRKDSAENKREVFAANAGQLPDGRFGAEARLQQAETAKGITALLSGREMDCLTLRADGLSYAEIGAVLDMCPGTVSAHLTRVHVKLRDATAKGPSHRWRAVEALYYLFQGRQFDSHRS